MGSILISGLSNQRVNRVVAMIMERIIQIAIERQYTDGRGADRRGGDGRGTDGRGGDRRGGGGSGYVEKVGILTSPLEVRRIYQIALGGDTLILMQGKARPCAKRFKLFDPNKNLSLHSPLSYSQIIMNSL